jgi:pimeloyl-ACP methyl ester carboxylesterase
MPIRAFTISVDEQTLVDLRDRLRRTRWPSEIDGAGWSMGTDPTYLRHLCDHWANHFDWRAHERAINAHPQFITEVGDDTIHFVHARAQRADRIPLLLMNGWPSNFYECLPLIPLLTSGSPPFDLVIPSLPGFGFSSAPKRSGLGTSEMADIAADLMTQLGYDRFVVCGGDVGAGVAEQLRNRHPERLLGAYVMNLQASHTIGDDPTDAELAYAEHAARWYREEGGYVAIQSTKPQTLAYGLSDSPAGMAGWIIEKWRAWSDCSGDLDSVFSLDDLCAILTIYWVTNTIGSSLWVYHASPIDRRPPVRGGPVPVGVAEFPGDVMPVVRERAEAWFRLLHFSQMPMGGHFAALEAPQLLAADLREFARKLSDLGVNRGQ